MKFETFLVGGALRDEFMGIKSKDHDFVVLAPSFEAMREAIVADGFTVHTEKPEFVTIRAGVPKDHPLRSHAKDADFVLARKDSATSDGRRPDFVEPGTLEDDLTRRDFTVNSLARNAVTGELVDLFGGESDIREGILRFVGNPDDRIREDGLRVLRGFRFMVTKGFEPEPETLKAFVSDFATEMLAKVSTERIREELERMFVTDTLQTLDILSHRMTVEMLDVIFANGLRLTATMAK